MYGQADIYNSPEGFGGIFDEEIAFGLHEFDDFGADDDDFDDFGADDDDDDEDDEFGLLGIALTRKARQKKWNKKLSRTLGKLKKLHEMGKMDKAQRRAKKLTKIVSKLQIVEDGFEPEAEVVAWMDFAESGDQAALEQALGATTWTGEEGAPAAGPAYPQDEYFRESGLVRTPASGIRGGAAPRRRRRLAPGFRPGSYGMWRRDKKLRWLARHPNAASAPDPRDPVRGRGPVPMAQAVPQRRGRAPWKRIAQRAAFQAGRRRGRRQTIRAQQELAQSGQPQPQRRRGPMRSAFRAGRRAGRAGYGAIEEAVTEMAEEMGAIPGTIGIEAFPGIDGSGLIRSTLLESDAIDDIIEFDDYEDEWDDEIEEGTTEAKIKEEGPQFGAVFKRKTEKRLESARRKYERLRDTAVTPDDWNKVEAAMRKYRMLAQAYKKAAVAPTPVKKEVALAQLEEQPLFRTSAYARFREAGGDISPDVLAPTFEDEPELASEEGLWLAMAAEDELD
jgi:hypothetical protein